VLSISQGFDKSSVINDIAILQMNEEFVLGDHIIPICLPKDSDILSQISTTDCIVAGWGKNPTGICTIIHWL
jgi:hypothetical protein